MTHKKQQNYIQFQILKQYVKQYKNNLIENIHTKILKL